MSEQRLGCVFERGVRKGILARNLSLHLSLLSFDRREVALDFVIERKRTDDLASSIVDGRTHHMRAVGGAESVLGTDYNYSHLH